MQPKVILYIVVLAALNTHQPRDYKSSAISFSALQQRRRYMKSLSSRFSHCSPLLSKENKIKKNTANFTVKISECCSTNCFTDYKFAVHKKISFATSMMLMTYILILITMKGCRSINLTRFVSQL